MNYEILEKLKLKRKEVENLAKIKEIEKNLKKINYDK